MTKAKLRGRGGAGFPTGLKWKLCRLSISEAHHVVCNADEGEPGAFKDRVLLTEIPEVVFDGMTSAGYALGARHGLVYLRGEYAYLWDCLQAAIEQRHRLGLLAKDVCGKAGFDFDIRIQLGAGADICGEELALIASLKGKRGAPRDRPPFPTDRGYLQQPTAVDNVESFACVVRIMEKGPEWFAGFGTRELTGTKLLSVSGDCARPGVYEVPFGITVTARPGQSPLQRAATEGALCGIRRRTALRSRGHRGAGQSGLRMRRDPARRQDADRMQAVRQALYARHPDGLSYGAPPKAPARRTGPMAGFGTVFAGSHEHQGLSPAGLDIRNGRIDLSHGSGGRAMAQLITDVFHDALDNEWLRRGNDQAAFDVVQRSHGDDDGRLRGLSALLSRRRYRFPSGSRHDQRHRHGAALARFTSRASFIIEEGFPTR